MGLAQQKSALGERRHQVLQQRMVQLTKTAAEATDLYAHLWDIHDGSQKLAGLIRKLTELDPEAEPREFTRVVYRIHVELYDHLLPHMRGVRKPLAELAGRLADKTR